MTRLSFAIVVVLFLGQAAVSFASAGPDACRIECSDDGPDGRCSPVCEDACCANALRTLMVNPDPADAPARSPQISTVRDGEGESPGTPCDVFHVPRPRLA